MSRRLTGIALAALMAAGLGGCRREIAGGRADGAAIYAEVCARCHGPDGVPDPSSVARLGVKPLTSEHVQERLSDEDIRQQILQGSRNRQMPSFAGALSDAQIEAIVQHVRTLRSGSSAAAQGVR
ncbi:MAG TPA: cytochrome c [Kofleriaceae bacterium]|nr:cytochrome c [Kofleriaceae bacterium]